MSRLLHSSGATCTPRTLQQRWPEAGPLNLFARHGCTANNTRPHKRCQCKRHVCRKTLPKEIQPAWSSQVVWLPQVAAALSRGCHECAATSQGLASERRLAPQVRNTKLLQATPCATCLVLPSANHHKTKAPSLLHVRADGAFKGDAHAQHTAGKELLGPSRCNNHRIPQKEHAARSTSLGRAAAGRTCSSAGGCAAARARSSSRRCSRCCSRFLKPPDRLRRDPISSALVPSGAGAASTPGPDSGANGVAVTPATNRGTAAAGSGANGVAVTPATTRGTAAAGNRWFLSKGLTTVAAAGLFCAMLAPAVAGLPFAAGTGTSAVGPATPADSTADGIGSLLGA